MRIINDALVGRRVLARGMSRPGTVTSVEVSSSSGGPMRRVYLAFAEPATELRADEAGVRPDDVLVIRGDEEFELVEGGGVQAAEYYRKIFAAVKSGFGGMLPNGYIVDRREHPEAMPIPKNTMLGAPEPKP
jgi:hypothetical protein